MLFFSPSNQQVRALSQPAQGGLHHAHDEAYTFHYTATSNLSLEILESLNDLVQIYVSSLIFCLFQPFWSLKFFSPAQNNSSLIYTLFFIDFTDFYFSSEKKIQSMPVTINIRLSSQFKIAISEISFKIVQELYTTKICTNLTYVQTTLLEYLKNTVSWRISIFPGNLMWSI